MENPRIVNVEGGIVVEDGDAGLPTYVDPGTDLYDRIINGEFGSVAPYEPPPPPAIEELRARASLTPMQFMLALEDMGLYDSVEAFVNDPETPKKIKIMWAKASSFDRLNPELVQMAAAMNFTDEQLDAVFGIE